MKTNSFPTDGNIPVDTLHWDTVYIASFPVVNAAILSQQSFPKIFGYTDDVSGIVISGTWTSWQLATGATGQSVCMECIVESGTVTGDNAPEDLSGTSIKIEVDLQTITSSVQIVDPTSKPGTGNPLALIVKPTGDGGDPAVSLKVATFPSGISGILKELLPAIFLKYFNENIDDFSHVFAVMNINEVADKDSFQWLKPNVFSYAISAADNTPLDQCAFGLMAMTGANSLPPLPQYAVDGDALLCVSGKANSAFVISQNMVAKNLLMHGAIAAIQGSTANDFQLSSDGLSVTNVNSLTWGNFQTESGIISPTIAANNFHLSAEDTYVYLEITDANYENSPGVTVHMNMTQKFTYSIAQAQNGNYVFVPDTKGLGNPQISANVSLSKALQIVEIITGAVAVLCSLLVIGDFAGFFSAAADVTMDTEANTGNIILSSETVNSIVENNPAEVTNLNQQGAADADAGAANPNNPALVQNGGLFSSSLFRVATGVTAAISGAISGSIICAEAITNLDYDNIPPFNDFASNCVSASLWPTKTNYTLQSAIFAKSLVIGVELS